MKCEVVQKHTACICRRQYIRKKKKKMGKFLLHYSVPKVTSANLSPGGIKFEILNIPL